jgi:hypothetical protein
MGPNCIGIHVEVYPTNTIIKNNLVVGGAPDIMNKGIQTVLNNNFCSVAGPGCSKVGNPRFIDPEARNFSLHGTSPAIDAGIILSEVKKDYKGVLRPQNSSHDAGALEYLSSTSHAYTLSIPKASYSSGEALTVSWSVVPGPGNPKDWIGFYLSTDTDDAKYIPIDGAGKQAWTYTNGQSSGTFTIVTPATPATYEFRYLLNNDNVSTATSPKVSITISSVIPPPPNLRIIP